MGRWPLIFREKICRPTLQYKDGQNHSVKECEGAQFEQNVFSQPMTQWCCSIIRNSVRVVVCFIEVCWYFDKLHVFPSSLIFLACSSLHSCSSFVNTCKYVQSDLLEFSPEMKLIFPYNHCCQPSSGQNPIVSVCVIIYWTFIKLFIVSFLLGACI